MKHQLIFYPVGNGDSSLLKLNNGKWLLFDYYHQKQGEDYSSPIIDLKRKLKDELSRARRDNLNVVTFTHLDNDHIGGSNEFFEFKFASKYQGDERIKINELWVPAAVILEKGLEGIDDQTIRSEARYRLEKGIGIKVFSKPDKLKDWLKEKGLTVEDRRSCIVDAGETVPGYSIAEDNIEFFCHAPFIEQIDDEEEYRNNASLILHATTIFAGHQSRIFIIGDADWEYLEKLYQITIGHNRQERLDWNLYYIPHHCSHNSLSTEKGEKETIPEADVKKLLEHGQANSYMVASCDPIDEDKEAHERKQPPHIQAKRCYERMLKSINGRRFMVTMEYPNRKNPKPMMFEIDSEGIKLETQQKPLRSTDERPPRAG